MSESKPQIQEAQRTASKQNKYKTNNNNNKNPTPRHTFELQKTKDKKTGVKTTPGFYL